MMLSQQAASLFQLVCHHDVHSFVSKYFRATGVIVVSFACNVLI